MFSNPFDIASLSKQYSTSLQTKSMRMRTGSGDTEKLTLLAGMTRQEINVVGLYLRSGSAGKMTYLLLHGLGATGEILGGSDRSN